MKLILTLLKKDLGIGNLNLKARFSNKEKRNQTLLAVFGIFLIAYFWIIFSDFIYQLYDVYEKTNITNIFLIQSFYGFIIITIMFSTYYMLNKIYFSNDIQILLPLPIKRNSILFVKIISMSIQNLATALFLIGPVMYTYGQKNNLGIIFYLSGIFSVFSTSILYVSIFGIFTILFMRKFSKYPALKTISQYLFMIISVIISIGINIFMTIFSGSDLNNGLQILENINSYYNTILNVFTNLKLVSYSLITDTGILGLLVSLLSFLGSLFIAFLISKIFEKFMVGGILQINSNKKSKILKKSKYNNKNKSVFRQLIIKDIRNLFSSPGYIFNSIIASLIFPVMILGFIVAQGKFSEVQANIESILGYAYILFYDYEIWLIFFMIGVGISGIEISSAISSSSISREGKNIWIIQTLPIKPEIQAISRILASMLIQITASLFNTVLVMYFTNYDMGITLSFLTGIILGSLLISEFGLLIDVFRPKLKWDNANHLMKQNLNLFLFNLFGLFMVGIIGYLIYIFVTKSFVTLGAIIIAIGVITFIILFYIIIVNLIPKKFRTYNIN